MAVFDQAARRAHLFADYGIPMMLARRLDEARVTHTIANWALSCCDVAVQAALCDLDHQCEQLLARASDWLQIALDERENPSPHYGPYIREAHCRHVLAVVKCLRTASLDRELLSSACTLLAMYFAGVTDKVEVAHNLPTFVLANKWEELENHFHNCRGLEAPEAGRSIKCPGKMSYLLAEHQLKDVPDTATLERAFGRFMAYQMSVCLGLRKNGLGTWREVPTWTVIDELRIGNAKMNGPACIR
jgi:hypothetical protein